jgi:DNA-binding CsgD family transcriptional regulator
MARAGVAELQLLGLDRSVVPFVGANLAEALIDSGNWDEADDVTVDGLEEAAEPAVAATLRVTRAQLLLRRGHYSEAAEMLDAVGQAVGQQHDAQAGAVLACRQAELALWRQNWDAARRAVERGQELTRDTDQTYALLLTCAFGARLEADIVDDALLAARPVNRAAHRDRALEHLALAESFLRRIEEAVGCHCGTFQLMLDLTSAETDRLTQPRDPQAWLGVAQLAGADDYLAAYASWRGSEAVLAGRGPHAQAAAALRPAYHRAARLGAVPLMTRIGDLAARAKIDLARAPEPRADKAGSPTETRPNNGLGLTDRETEVLRLIGRGLSNGQIADTLYISPKTASVHVSNILRKLAVTSRVQAAAIAHRAGLLDQ